MVNMKCKATLLQYLTLPHIVLRTPADSADSAGLWQTLTDSDRLLQTQADFAGQDDLWYTFRVRVRVRLRFI